MNTKIISLEYKIKTSISDKKFYNEDSEEAFMEWLLDKIKKENLDRIKINTNKTFDDLPTIEKIELYLEAIEYDATLCFNIYLNEEFDYLESWDIYDKFIQNNAFISYIEQQFIQEYIIKFNEQCNIKFPTFDDDFRDYIEVKKGGYFYAYLYSSDDKGFEHCSIKNNTFKLLNDFEANF